MAKYVKCTNPDCEQELILALIWENNEVTEYRAICEGTRHGYYDYRGGCETVVYVTHDKLTGRNMTKKKALDRQYSVEIKVFFKPSFPLGATLKDMIDSRFKDTRAGKTHPDCCSNCKHFETLNLGYVLKEGVDRAGYWCKHTQKELLGDRIAELSICPGHIRPKCVKCQKPLNHPNASYCQTCQNILVEEELNSQIINVITGERLGTVRELMEKGEL